MEEMKNEVSLFKKVLKYIGIILMCLCGIVLFGGDKVASGIMLIVTAIIIALPVRQSKILRLARVAFVCAVFLLVIWNISTTQLPGDVPGNIVVGQTSNNAAEAYEYTTGIRFFNQLLHIFRGFLEGRVFTHFRRIFGN